MLKAPMPLVVEGEEACSSVWPARYPSLHVARCVQRRGMERGGEQGGMVVVGRVGPSITVPRGSSVLRTPEGNDQAAMGLYFCQGAGNALDGIGP